MAMHAGRQRNELLALDAARVLFGAVAHVVGLREVWEDVRPLFKRAAHEQTALGASSRTAPRIAPRASGTELAITVDDLPAQGSLPAAVTLVDVIDRRVAVLRQHRVPGVVGFVNGGPVEAVPAYGVILQRWVAAGYRFGNHTFRHTDLDRSGPARFIIDIERNEIVIARYSPAEHRRMFRYPYLREGRRRATGTPSEAYYGSGVPDRAGDCSFYD